MRFRYTESFPDRAPEGEDTLGIIRKIVEDRLAEEIGRRLKEPGDRISPRQRKSDIL